VVATTTSRLDTVISLPAKALGGWPGNGTVWIASLEPASPDPLYPWQPLNFNISVTNSITTVAVVSPTAVQSAGGDLVEVIVLGLPGPPSKSIVNVTIGSVAAPVVEVSAFEEGQGKLRVRVVSPPLELGMADVAVALFLAGHLPAVRINVGGGALLVQPGSNFGLNMSCVAGCVFAAGAGLGLEPVHSAAVEVWTHAGLNLASPSSRTWLGCLIPARDAPSLDPHATTVHCTVLPLSPFAFQSCAAAAAASAAALGVLCTRIAAKLVVSDQAAANYVSSEMTSALFVLEVNDAGEQRRQRQLSAMAAAAAVGQGPKLIRARLGDALGTLHIVFDQPVLLSSTECSALVDNATQVLGNGAICECIGPAELTLHLDAGAQAATPGAVVLLQVGGFFAVASGLPLVAAHARVTIEPPRRGRAPAPSIAGPGEVAECDTADVFVQGSVAGYKYMWGCADDAVLDRSLQQLSPRTAIVIDGATLAVGRTYTITCYVCLLDGTLCSDPATHILGRRQSATVAPFLIFLPAPGQIVSRLNIPRLEVSVIHSTCFSAGVRHQISFEWALCSSTDRGNVLVRHTGPTFIIPSSILAAGNSYIVRATAVNNEGGVASAERQFAVVRDPVVAILDGGGCLVAAGSLVLLNASRSYAPDACLNLDSATYSDPRMQLQTNQPEGCDRMGLSFAWACSTSSIRGAPCLLHDGSLLAIPTTAAVELDLAQLASLDEGGKVWVTVTVTAQGSAVSQAALITVAPAGSAPPLEVQINLVYANADALAVRAKVDWGSAGEPPNAKLAWRVLNGAATPLAEAGSLDSVTSDVGVFPAGMQGLAFIVRFNSQWARAVLRAGGRYAVSIIVNDGRRTGTAWLDFIRPVPPTGGSCSAAQDAKVPMEIVVIQCGGWTSTRTPLKYRFAAATGLGSATDGVLATAAGRGIDLTWTPSSVVPRFEALLPPGPVTLLAMILDSDENSAVIVIATLNISTGGINRSSQGFGMPLGELMAGLTYLESVGRVSQLLLFADVIALHLNSYAFSTSTSGSDQGCSTWRWQQQRRQGSSYGYRMTVRKLLLQKLAGQALLTATADTATTVLRTSRRVAAVPAELDEGAANSAGKLLATLTTGMGLGTGALLTGIAALEDAARLASSVLMLNREKLAPAKAGSLYAITISGLLNLLASRAAGLLEGEIPPASNVHGLDLLILPLPIPAGSAVPLTVHLTESWPGAPTGLAMVRASSEHMFVVDTGNGVLNVDGIAVKLLYYGPAASPRLQFGSESRVPVCPAKMPWCVEFTLAVSVELCPSHSKTKDVVEETVIAGGYLAECAWWDSFKSQWDFTVCKSPAIMGISADQKTVSCACALDGVFSVSISSLPFKQLPLLACQMALAATKCSVSTYSVIVVAVLSLTVVIIGCIVHLQCFCCLETLLYYQSPLAVDCSPIPAAIKAELGYFVVDTVTEQAKFLSIEHFSYLADSSDMLQGLAGISAMLSKAEGQWCSSGYNSFFLVSLSVSAAALNVCCEAGAEQTTVTSGSLALSEDCFYCNRLPYSEMQYTNSVPACLEPTPFPTLAQLPISELGGPNSSDILAGTPVNLLDCNTLLLLAHSPAHPAKRMLVSDASDDQLKLPSDSDFQLSLCNLSQASMDSPRANGEAATSNGIWIPGWTMPSA
jgi:hypothetical protein